jgi:hypothetical protein
MTLTLNLFEENQVKPKKQSEYGLLIAIFRSLISDSRTFSLLGD